MPLLELNFLLLCATAIAFVAIGFTAQRRTKSQQVITLGWFRIAAGLSMTFVGGAATIAMAGIGYANGPIGFVDPVAVLAGGALVAVVITARSLPRAGQGISHFLAHQDQSRKVIYALCSLFVYVLLASAQIVALEKIFVSYVDPTTSAIISTLVFLAISGYILWGGIGAVTKTDVVQFGVVVMLFFVPTLYGIELLSDSTSAGLARPQVPLDLRTILLLSLSFLFVPLSQDVWVRVRSARSVNAARVGIIAGSIIYFAIVGSAIVLGHLGAQAGITVGDAESILPYIFLNEIGLAGVVTGIVLLAAIMSTLDSFTFNINTTIIDDILQRPGGSERLTRVAVAALVFGTCSLIALAATSVLGLVLLALMIYVSVIGPGFVLSRFARRSWVISAPALATLLAIISMAMAELSVPYEPYSIIVLHSALICMLIGVERSLLTERKE